MHELDRHETEVPRDVAAERAAWLVAAGRAERDWIAAELEARGDALEAWLYRSSIC